MHICEGLLPLPHAAAWWAISAPFVLASALTVRKSWTDGSPEERTLQKLSGVLIFALTCVPIPIPGIGVTAHMCATPVVGLILSPLKVIFPTMVALLIQALFLGHGGLSSLGANVFTLGVVGPFAAWTICRVLLKIKLPAAAAIACACGVADALVYLTDAGVVSAALASKAHFMHWFWIVLAALAPVQVPLAVLESLVSVALVKALSSRCASLVPGRLRIGLVAVPASTVALMLFIAMVLTSMQTMAHAAPYQGVDDALFGGLPRSGQNWMPWLGHNSELETSFFTIAGLVSGFLVGTLWERLRKPGASK